MCRTLTKRVKLVCLILFLVTVVSRLYGISSPVPRLDESRWESRSDTLVNQLRVDDYSSASTTLLSSGMPAVLVMTLGQISAKGYNHWKDLTPGDRGYLDRLIASRIAVSLFSSLVVPVLFAGSVSLLGFWPALLGAAFLVLDPHHLVFSRMATPDNILTLLITVSLLLYADSLYSQGYRLKLYTGLCWGLAIALNPMCLGLLIVFFTFRLAHGFLKRVSKKNHEKSGSLWGDIWVVIISQLTMVILNKALWIPESEYKTWSGPVYTVGKALHRSGIWLTNTQEMVWIVVVLGIVGCLLGILLNRGEKKRPLLFHGGMFLGLVSTILLVLTLVPQVPANIVYFWNWTIEHAGKLYGVRHQGGNSLRPFAFLVFRAPSILLVGILILLGTLSSQYAFKSSQSEKAEKISRLSSLGLLLVFSIVLWALPLSLISNQASRYLITLIPFIYFFVAGGLSLFSEKALGDKLAQDEKRLLKGILGASLVVFQAAILYSWSPHYHLFFNALSGGLSGAYRRGQLQETAGEIEMLAFLHNRAAAEAQKTVREKRVAVLGDIQTLQRAYQRLIRSRSSWLKFEGRFQPIRSDLLIAAGSFSHPQVLYRSYPLLKNLKPIYDYRFRGVRLIAAYEIPLPSYLSPFVFEPGRWSQGTGTVRIYEGTTPVRATSTSEAGTRMVLAVPRTHSTGALMYDVHLRVPAAAYRARFLLGIPSDKQVNPNFSAGDYVVRLDLGKKCSRIVTLGELSNKELRTIEVECIFSEATHTQLAIYWFGHIPVLVSQVEFSQRPRDFDQATAVRTVLVE